MYFPNLLEPRWLFPQYPSLNTVGVTVPRIAFWKCWIKLESLHRMGSGCRHYPPPRGMLKFTGLVFIELVEFSGPPRAPPWLTKAKSHGSFPSLRWWNESRSAGGLSCFWRACPIPSNHTGVPTQAHPESPLAVVPLASEGTSPVQSFGHCLSLERQVERQTGNWELS